MAISGETKERFINPEEVLKNKQKQLMPVGIRGSIRVQHVACYSKER